MYFFWHTSNHTSIQIHKDIMYIEYTHSTSLLNQKMLMNVITINLHIILRSHLKYHENACRIQPAFKFPYLVRYMYICIIFYLLTVYWLVDTRREALIRRESYCCHCIIIDLTDQSLE